MACHYKPYHLHHARTSIDSVSSEGKSVLLIMDVQKAFLPGGSMSILNNRSDAKMQSLMMIQNINSLIESGKFDYHIYVQDSHPHDHISFASSREGAKPFQVVEINHDDKIFQQIMWPDHCRIDGRDYAPRSITGAANTDCKSGSGIQFATELIVPESFLKNGKSDPSNNNQSTLAVKSYIFNKGEEIDVDSYSAFKDYFGKDTGLHSALISKGVTNIYVCGLARDFGAWWTAADASSYVDSSNNAVFDVKMIWDATLPAPGDSALLEYEYDGEIESPHHNKLRSDISTGKYDIADVMKGLVSHDPNGNRWVRAFLKPYNVDAVNTGNLLGVPASASVRILNDLNQNQYQENPTARIEEDNVDQEQSNLSFIKGLQLQDTMSNTSTLRDIDTVNTETL
jgi:nicotinamidase/pyrazinamidase